MDNIEQIVLNFKNSKILVIGDVMLDEYIIGEVNRISPEAPVQIVNAKKYYCVPGGAANTARNITSLGGNASLVGVIGTTTKYENLDEVVTDEAGEKLIASLKTSNILTTGIISSQSYSTIRKVRVMGQAQHHLLRIDYEEKYSPSSNDLDKLRRVLDVEVPKCDLVIVSDYAKGLINREFITYLKFVAKNHDKKIIADIKPINKEYFKDVYLIKPNKKEAQEMTGLNITDDASAAYCGKELKKYFNSNILMTRSEAGMDLFEKQISSNDSTYSNIKARELQITDVSGAGDTVIATLGLCLAQGLNLQDSAEIANYAAGIVVGKVGTATASSKELIEYILNKK
jgi:D-beta-D-heptose 7-phosphate kinase/D-beta-D-heptose 1-phosphate adenosyltransferase